jgi:hypothetical protein
MTSLLKWAAALTSWDKISNFPNMAGVHQKDSGLGMYFAFFSVIIDSNWILIEDLCFSNRDACFQKISNLPYLAVNCPLEHTPYGHISLTQPLAHMTLLKLQAHKSHPQQPMGKGMYLTPR